MAESDRFTVTYLVNASSQVDAEKRAADITIEQTAEMPVDAIPEWITDEWTGLVREIEPADEYLNSKRRAKESQVVKSHATDKQFRATISYPLHATGNEISQTLNLLFGNISLKPGIRVLSLDWEPLKELFPGPRFGVSGLRRRLGVPGRTLTCTALKPMGLNFAELADLAYRFARGGIDIIKDDHGLANQQPAPFVDRVKAVVSAVNRAADRTGRKSAYYPNITADGVETWRRYEIAEELGADGVLISPELTGLSTLAALAKAGSGLPLMAHPAFSGGHVLNPEHGLSPDFYYGSLWRALGADAVIYPNASGRFSFSDQQCVAINDRLRGAESPFKPAFPVPAGGIQRDSVEKWIELYGPDTIILIGGSLYQHPNGIESAAREFQHLVEDASH